MTLNERFSDELTNFGSEFRDSTNEDWSLVSESCHCDHAFLRGKQSFRLMQMCLKIIMANTKYDYENNLCIYLFSNLFSQITQIASLRSQ